MKKIFLAFTVTVFACFSLVHQASAQNVIGINEEDMPLLSTPVSLHLHKDSSMASNFKGINTHAVKNFHRDYPEVTNERWSVAADRGYIANFSAGTTKTFVAYNRNGSMNHTISYYGEENLPREVRQVVKSTYYDYVITTVAEVNINDMDAQTIYVINMEDSRNIKIVTVRDFEIVGVKDLKKSIPAVD